MKTFKDISLKITEQEYHDLPYWSYSMISKYAKGGFDVLPYLNKKTTPTPAMEFGSLFDSIMTKGKKTLDEYAIIDITIPEAEKKALEYIATHSQQHFDELSPNTIDTLCDQCKYYSNWSIDARMKHLVPFKGYYELKLSGKKLVTAEDWSDAMEMYHAFRQNRYLCSIFGTKSNQDVEYLYQLKFLIDYSLGDTTVKIKFMPDLIVVNHKEKTIRPVDLKTSSEPAATHFKESFLQMHYYLQAELYTDGIKHLIATDLNEAYGDYTVLPYLFTDVSRTDKIPVTFEYDPSNGFSFTKNDRLYSYRGWKELLAEIMEYQINQAKVPSYITTDGPNDLIALLSY